MREEQKAINELKQKLEADRQRVSQQEADNWRETAVIRSRQKELENEVAVIERDRGVLVKRAQQLELQEDQRRRNRFVMLLNHDRTLENDDCVTTGPYQKHTSRIPSQRRALELLLKI